MTLLVTTLRNLPPPSQYTGEAYVTDMGDHGTIVVSDGGKYTPRATDVKPVTTATANLTTQPVVGVDTLLLADSSAITIVAFSGGVPGQVIYVHASTANSTIAHNAAIILQAGVAKTLAVTDVLCFQTVDGTVFKQV